MVGSQFGNVNVDAVSQREDRTAACALDESVDDRQTDLGGPGCRVGLIPNIEIGDSPVTSRDGDGGDASVSGGVSCITKLVGERGSTMVEVHSRSACSSRKSPDKRTQVCAVVGPGYHQVGNTEVRETRQDVVERDEGAGRRRAVVVPDMAVKGIAADLKQLCQRMKSPANKSSPPKRSAGLTDGAPAGIRLYCAGPVKLASVVKTDLPPWPLCGSAGATIQT